MKRCQWGLEEKYRFNEEGLGNCITVTDRNVRYDTVNILKQAVVKGILSKRANFHEKKQKSTIEGSKHLDDIEINISLQKTGISTPAVSQSQQQLSSAKTILSQATEVTTDRCVTRPIIQKVFNYTRKNWWLILLPMPVIGIVIIVRHLKRKF